MVERVPNCVICLEPFTTQRTERLPEYRYANKPKVLETDAIIQANGAADRVDQFARAKFTCDHGPMLHLKCAVRHFHTSDHEFKAFKDACPVCNALQYNALGQRETEVKYPAPKPSGPSAPPLEDNPPAPLTLSHREHLAIATGCAIGMILTTLAARGILGKADLASSIDARGLLSAVTRDQGRKWLSGTIGAHLGITTTIFIIKKVDRGRREGNWNGLARKALVSGLVLVAGLWATPTLLGNLTARLYGIPQRAMWVAKEYAKLPINYVQPINLAKMIGASVCGAIATQTAYRLWHPPTDHPGLDASTRMICSAAALVATVAVVNTAAKGLVRRFQHGNALVYPPYSPGIGGKLGIGFATLYCTAMVAIPLVFGWVAPRHAWELAHG